jgi:outer membrane receptor protein involved in Fe transport
VDEDQRGVVDTPAASEDEGFVGRVERGGFHAGVNLFDERRRNGTELQTNSSRLRMFDAGYQGGSWGSKIYVQSSRLQSAFSRILPDRSAEFLTSEQDIHALGAGGSLTWKSGERLLAGSDWRYAGAEGDGQHLAGVFAEDTVAVHPRLDLLLGARLDAWQNRHTQTAFDPRAGVLFRAAAALTLRASAYGGFRAPTLNELYRPFRVGNVSTLANPDLDAERLWGAEIGADVHPTPRLLLRFNTFWNSLRDPVGNVTLSVSPDLVLRQRQNLGRATIRGLEAEVNAHFLDRWLLRAAYLRSDAVVEDTGLRLPQAPLHQGSVEVRWRGPVTVSAAARWIGDQFEDDRNTLVLEGYGVYDLALRRVISDRYQMFLSMENVLDRAYAVGRTPVETLGTPRLIHGGLGLRLGR